MCSRKYVVFEILRAVHGWFVGEFLRLFGRSVFLIQVASVSHRSNRNRTHVQLRVVLSDRRRLQAVGRSHSFGYRDGRWNDLGPDHPFFGLLQRARGTDIGGRHVSSAARMASKSGGRKVEGCTFSELTPFF